MSGHTLKQNFILYHVRVVTIVLAYVLSFELTHFDSLKIPFLFYLWTFISQYQAAN